MKVNTPIDNNPVVTALQIAAQVAARLAAQGVYVNHAFANGRSPVLVIDHPPAFIRGVVKRSTPTGAGGVEQVWAAPFYGVQLEWLVQVPGMREVAHV